jgi:hypothetical protein
VCGGCKTLQHGKRDDCFQDSIQTFHDDLHIR